MKFIELDMKIVSADNLPNVRWFWFMKMKVYAEVCFNGKPETSRQTAVDMTGKSNPRWNHHLNYTINKASLRKAGLEMVVKLYSQGTWGAKNIGEVKILVKDLFARRRRGEKELSFDVAGTENGRLTISYSFGNVFTDQEPSCWIEALRAGLRVVFAVMVEETWIALGI